MIRKNSYSRLKAKNPFLETYFFTIYFIFRQVVKNGIKSCLFESFLIVVNNGEKFNKNPEIRHLFQQKSTDMRTHNMFLWRIKKILSK